MSRIPRRIARTLHRIRVTRLDMIMRRVQLGQLIRTLDHRGHEPGFDMPFDVTVEQPYPRVVGAVPDHEVGLDVRHDGVSFHGVLREVTVAGEGARVGA